MIHRSTALLPFRCISLPRLQDLLSGQFNVTLGDKLSEHLKKWIDVGNILQPPQPVRHGLDEWHGTPRHAAQ